MDSRILLGLGFASCNEQRLFMIDGFTDTPAPEISF